MNTLFLRHRVAAATSALLLLAVGACSAGAESGSDSNSEDNAAVDATSVETEPFTLDATHAQLNDAEVDTAGATTITLADGASSVDGAGATATGDVISISEPGTYVLSGTLTDGQVVVDSAGDGKVNLVLDGVDITSTDNSPIVFTAADEAVVLLADGSTNTLSDSAASADDDEVEDAPNATLYSMADLTIAGSGSLDVTGASNDGIGSQDGLVILSGTITVNAVDDGIRGKDYLVVEDGDLTVEGGGDGLKADNEDAGELGWVLIDGGELTVAGQSDGVDAVGGIYVTGGNLTVPASEEGLEAAVITISGGVVDVTATDDGINTTSGTEEGGTEAVEDGVMLTVSGGTVLVDAGSDGLDSNGNADLSGGTVAINGSSTGGGGNGPLDVNGTLESPATVTIATDSVAAGETIEITNEAGDVVATFDVGSPAPSVVVTASGLEAGSTYTVTAGDSALGDVTATEPATAGGGRGGPPPGR